jgi:hypothetical protein
MQKEARAQMADWSELTKTREQSRRNMFSRALILAVEEDCLTRKPRDPEKLILIRQLGLPERYPEVQYPSPGNTPDDLENEDL